MRLPAGIGHDQQKVVQKEVSVCHVEMEQAPRARDRGPVAALAGAAVLDKAATPGKVVEPARVEAPGEDAAPARVVDANPGPPSVGDDKTFRLQVSVSRFQAVIQLILTPGT